MKLRIIPALVLLILSLWLVSCVPGTVGTSIEVSCDDFGSQPHMSKEINVTAGNSFTVTLCSNPTTGFQWSESAQISEATVVQQLNHKSLPPETELVGAPGKQVWTFKALKEGISTVSLEYSRPWEGGEKGEWTFDLTVVVK
jgi:inhibitor of cysteine peptidase